MKNFEDRILQLDWTKYLEPEYYDPEIISYYPERVAEALIALENFDESDAPHGIASKVRFAVGNDHRGTYYPAALEAIDLIIELSNTSEDERVRKCAYGILHDWYYFQLEMPHVDPQLFEAVDGSIRGKLQIYADDEG